MGRIIYLNGLAFTVIGVVPQSFTGPNPLVNAALYALACNAPPLGRRSSPQ
ncbi:MAG: hypothetical protein WDO73_31555 [Ignavibacteriota bacterium]